MYSLVYTWSKSFLFSLGNSNKTKMPICNYIKTKTLLTTSEETNILCSAISSYQHFIYCLYWLSPSVVVCLFLYIPYIQYHANHTFANCLDNQNFFLHQVQSSLSDRCFFNTVVNLKAVVPTAILGLHSPQILQSALEITQ